MEKVFKLISKTFSTLQQTINYMFRECWKKKLYGNAQNFINY
jgi:hypothetical protein